MREGDRGEDWWSGLGMGNGFRRGRLRTLLAKSMGEAWEVWDECRSIGRVVSWSGRGPPPQPSEDEGDGRDGEEVYEEAGEEEVWAEKSGW